MQKNGNKGFTLVELIVVIAIIAILAAVSIVGYNQFIQQARDSRASTELDVIVRQIESEYYVDPYEGEINAFDVTVAFDPSTSTFTLTEVEQGALDDADDVVAALVAAINNAMDSETVAVAADPGENADPGKLFVDATEATIATFDGSADVSDEVTLTYYVLGGSVDWTFDIVIDEIV